MARIISFEGREVEVPDDATETEVAQILGVPLQMEAAPKPKKGFEFSDILAVPAAIGEVGLQMGTGALSQVVGGGRGILSLLSGEGVDEAARKVTEVTEGGTYQPQTTLGKGASQAIAYPFQKGMELTKQAGGAVGEFVGGEQGRIAGEAIGEQVIPVAGAVAPLVPVARGTLSKPSAAKMSAKIEEIQKAAPKIEIAKKGQELGFVFDPAELNPTTKNKLQTFVAGDKQVDLLAAKKNADAASVALKKEIGIDPDVALNKSSVNEAIKQFGTAYEDVRGLGKLQGSQEIANKLRSSFPEDIPGAEASIGKAKKVLDKVANRVESGTLTGDSVVDFIKYYRNEGKKIKNSPASKESQRAKADAYMDAANALEDLIESNITDKTVLSNFRKSRENIAKAYTIDEIINPVTGTPDLLRLTTGKLADAPLTGNLKTLREIAFAFPDTVALGSKYGDMSATLPRTGPGGSAGALAGSAVGATAQGSVIGAAYGKLLGNRVREKLLSPEYQRANLLPEYARYINEGRIQSPLTQSMPRAVPPAPTSTLPVPYVSQGETYSPGYVPNWRMPRQESPSWYNEAAARKAGVDIPPDVTPAGFAPRGLLGVEDDFSRMAKQREAFNREQIRQTAVEGEVMPKGPNWQPYRPPLLEDARRVDIPSGAAQVRNQFANQKRLVDAEAIKIRNEIARAEAEYADWARTTAERNQTWRESLNEMANNPRVMSDAEKRMDKLMKSEAKRRMEMQQRIRAMRDREAELMRLQDMLSTESERFVGQGPKTRAAQRGMLYGE